MADISLRDFIYNKPQSLNQLPIFEYQTSPVKSERDQD